MCGPPLQDQVCEQLRPASPDLTFMCSKHQRTCTLCIYIYIYNSLSVFLSLSLYIYIYIYI